MSRLTEARETTHGLVATNVEETMERNKSKDTLYLETKVSE